MPDLYEHVQTPSRSRGNRPLVIALTVCLILLALVVGLSVWFTLYQRRYWEYIGDFSASVSYAYEHDCLRADVNGQSLRVNGEVSYAIYNKISIAGIGKIRSGRPLDESILLDYGDGSTLQLWDVPLSGKDLIRDHGVFLLYTDPQGRSYSYDTDKLSYEDFELYLSPSRNPLWEE